MTLPRPLVTILRLGIPLAILAILWVVADGPSAAARLADTDPLWIAASILLLTTQTALSAERWRRVAAALGLVIPRGQAIRECFVAMLVNQTLPGGVTGDIARAIRSRAGAGLVRAAQAVAIERLAGQIALFGLTAVALAIAVLLPGGIRWPVPPAGGILTLVSLGAALALILWVLRRGAAGRFLGLARLALLGPGVRGPQALLAVLIVACNLCGFACAARATGTALGVEATLTLVPLILAAMLVPLSVGGWGLREGAAAALFPLAGATPEAGLAASIAFGLAILASSLPGAAWLVRRTAAPGNDPADSSIAAQRQRSTLRHATGE